MKTKIRFGLMFSLLALIQLGAYCDSFPLRSKYSDVQVYSTEQLKNGHDKAVIVDVRSQLEYNVVHINKAVNVSVSRIDFLPNLAKHRTKEDTRPIVFYCNGHTCAKSYKAAQKAMKAGYKNVFAYDAGVFEWINKHPEMGTLMGASPVAKDKIISSENFKKRLLDYSSFEQKSKGANVIVVDVRDPMQRTDKLPIKSSHVYLDKFVTYLKRGIWKDKEILIYDAVGKQVRWVQYHLELNGYKNYHFLAKGARGAKKMTVQSK